MLNHLKNEKATLIAIFTILFLLSSSLIYLMITKDLKSDGLREAKINESREIQRIEENWPKIEIQTRQ